VIGRAGDDERRTCDLAQAASAVEGHRLVPRRNHQLAVLVREEPDEPVGTFRAEPLGDVRGTELRKPPRTKAADEKQCELALDPLASCRHVERIVAMLNA
jgi:hypothetical protein